MVSTVLLHHRLLFLLLLLLLLPSPTFPSLDPCSALRDFTSTPSDPDAPVDGPTRAEADAVSLLAAALSTVAPSSLATCGEDLRWAAKRGGDWPGGRVALASVARAAAAGGAPSDAAAMYNELAIKASGDVSWGGGGFSCSGHPLTTPSLAAPTGEGRVLCRGDKGRLVSHLVHHSA